jgi:glycosyltransferase involved in cell wall biosynthesis
MNNKFCVVTPNLNMCKYLPETIDSVLANLGPNDEYFIIDGGSTDGSVELLKSYGNRIKGWVSEPDRSYAEAVAKGFSRSNNDFQCWIASGDLLLPGALALAREELMSPSIDMVFGDDLFIDEDTRILQISNGYAPNLAQMMLGSLWTPLQDACFWKRSLYNRVGGIYPDIRFAADYDLFLRMAVMGRTQYTPKVFSAFRRHSGQTSKLHQRAYKQEKIESCENLLASFPLARSSSPFSSAFYWLYPRLRSRLMNNKKYSKHVIGHYALKFAASPTSIFGVQQ